MTQYRTWCLTLVLLAAAPAIAAGQSWWARETALGADGALMLSDQNWWPRAESLAVGESFVLRSEYNAEGLMIVRRELGTPIPYKGLEVWGAELLQDGREMIVWILDDDEDMDPEAPLGDRDSDAYVVDYGANGTVDRLLDYHDADGDDDPDAQNIRYFSTEGKLRHSIVHQDLDDDDQMYPTHDYQRLVGPQLAFLIDAYGDNMYFHSKYNPEDDAWIPFSECPFAFHDLDDDRQTERVVRFSAAPLAFDADEDPDFANSWSRLMGPFEPMMEDMGLVNIRYTFDIDNGSSEDQPLHYEFAFNLIGGLPYAEVGEEFAFAGFRPPRTWTTVPHDQTIAVAESFWAEAAGFTWREFEDGTVEFGDWRDRPAYDQRWEGIFWTWRRQFMHNTGGPNQHWNMRREYRPTPGDSRELYYSPVDRRFHLKGASEGWLHVGALGHEEPIGEIRMFDTTADGYFDRWEYYVSGEEKPYRVASVPQAENRDFGSDWEAISTFYTDELLPRAISRNQRLIDRFTSSDVIRGGVPDDLSNALQGEITEGERLYVMDVIREHFYRAFEDTVLSAVDPHLDSYSHSELVQGQTRRLHNRAWEVNVLLARWKAAYNRGDYSAGGELFEEIENRLPELR
jgi:hypothetical protein